MIKKLFWKEWREQRLFFFLAIGIIILSRLVPIFIPKEVMHYEKYAGILSHFVLPILFSLFLGAISFTNEFTRNTKQFLLSHPFTPAKIFWTKFLSGLILLLILALLAHFAFGVPLENLFVDPAKAKEAHWSILPLPLFLIVIYSSACLSSLLLKNILLAIICTPFILLLVFLIPAAFACCVVLLNSRLTIMFAIA